MGGMVLGCQFGEDVESLTERLRIVSFFHGVEYLRYLILVRLHEVEVYIIFKNVKFIILQLTK
jgi:hypothetical protein